MKLIVGLGNSGKQYEKTRHNLGFLVIDELGKRWNLSFKKDFSSEIATFFLNDEKIIILKPGLFMNKSGEIVKVVVDYYKLNIDDIIFFVDDKDQEMGKIKIINYGGHGGQNGIRNIIDYLKTKKFLRVRAGIGNDFTQKTSDYVLSKWSMEQKKQLNNFVEKLADIAIKFVNGKKFDELANEYNGKK